MTNFLEYKKRLPTVSIFVRRQWLQIGFYIECAHYQHLVNTEFVDNPYIGSMMALNLEKSVATERFQAGRRFSEIWIGCESRQLMARFLHVFTHSLVFSAINSFQVLRCRNTHRTVGFSLWFGFIIFPIKTVKKI